MRAQSVSSARARPRVAGGDRGLQRVGAERAAERLGAVQRRQAAADQQPVPAAAVLVEQQHRLARRARRARRRRDAWISISATRPCTSGSRGASPARMRPRRSASSHSAGPHPVVARGRRVALVEDRGRRPRAPTPRRAPSSAPRGTSNGTRASASVRLARTMRWAMVGSGTRNARAISSVVRPPSRRSVSATRASVDSTGWQVVKIRPQQVVADLVVERPRRGPASARACAPRARAPSSSCLRSSVAPRRSWSIAAVLGGGHQPGARVVRDARLGPLLERGDQRVLGEVLGQADVAHHAREAGDQPRRLDPPDGLDRAVGVAGHARPRLARHPCCSAMASRSALAAPRAPRGVQAVAEVLGLEDLADLDLRLAVHRVRAALDPLDGLVHRLHLR